ncbi:hypothetical protein [Kiloniella sp. b19]|uniref:hypothetical protein n=1 Tax=Kiloniella sp. GXU_MW_B19 TaxID=3141326 RepID=UPI0031E21F7B
MRAVMVLIAVLGLNACKTVPDDVTVKGDGYEVTVGDEKSGDFCPPGQAKKGNC